MVMPSVAVGTPLNNRKSCRAAAAGLGTLYQAKVDNDQYKQQVRVSDCPDNALFAALHTSGKVKHLSNRVCDFKDFCLSTDRFSLCFRRTACFGGLGAPCIHECSTAIRMLPDVASQPCFKRFRCLTEHGEAHLQE